MRLTLSEETVLDRLKLFQVEVTKQDFIEESCPLLENQLLEAEVIARKYLQCIAELRKKLAGTVNG